jgi:nucleotide-binding universal stress UspA family protein
MFKKIVVPTDGSANAKRAVETAAKLAATCGAKLTLVHCVPTYVSIEEVESSPKFNDLPQTAREEIKRTQDTLGGLEFSAMAPIPAPRSATDFIGNTLLEEAEGIARTNNIAEISRMLVYGTAADNIIDAARTAGADLIVIGTRGLSDLRGLVVGSVSHKVMQMADCPCLMVK